MVGHPATKQIARSFKIELRDERVSEFYQALAR
jgi:hypothetical protein